MTRQLTRLVTCLTGTLLTLGLLVGPPWLLTTLVGPPIPTSWPDLDTLRSITTVGVTDTFVVTTLAVIVWIAWAQLATAIAIETFAALKRGPRIRLPLLPGTQPLAARLVAATLLLTSTVQPRPLAAAPFDVPAVPVAAAVTHIPEASAVPATPDRPGPPGGTVTVTAAERDSWWSLAETHLGDGLRWREIRHLNLNRKVSSGAVVQADTDRVEAGWDLLVPAAADPAAPVDSQTPDTQDTTDVADTAAAEEEVVWEVGRGEHFWGAAAHTLEQAWGRTPTDTEVIPYWQQLVEVNGDRLAPPHDPDLIYPGQQFVLPDPPPDPAATPPSPPGTDNATDAVESDTPAATPAPSAPQPASPPPAPTDPAEPAAPAASEEPARQHAPSAHQNSGGLLPDHLDLNATQRRPAPDDGGQAADAQPGGTALQIPAGLHSAAAAAALAAAGIVALLGRRRRTALQQRTPTWRLPTLAPDFIDHLGTLTVATPPEEVLDDLADLLSTVPEEANPTLVLIHDSGPISLVFDQPDTETPPPPWVDDYGEGDPPRWTAPLGSRGPRRSIGLPLLLTVGRTGATTVLANLGAITTLPVTGPAPQVSDRLRSAALELACSRTAGPLEVTVIAGTDVPDIEQLRTADDPSAAIAAALDDAEQGIIADDRLPRIIICHDPDRQLDLPAATTGYLALLTAATGTPPGWRLQVDGTDTWLHTPDGGRHHLTSPDLRPQLIVDELDRLQPDTATPDRPEPPSTATHADATPSHEPEAKAEPAPQPTPQPEPAPESEPWCVVAVLGPLQVTCGGQPLDSLTPTVRQLLPYLATHRHGVTLDRLDEVIWPGRTPSRKNQRARTALTRLRQTLGNGPDGQPLVTRRDHGDQPVTLSKSITTDIDRAMHHLERAKTCHADHRLGHLQAALDLVRGEPFQDLPYPWTLDVQQHAITHLQDAALTAAGLLRQASRYEAAEHAIRQGLALYDPCEPLYVEWARLEQARGRPDRIDHLQRRLRQRYNDQADETSGTITTPTAETELAFTTLAQGRADRTAPPS